MDSPFFTQLTTLLRDDAILQNSSHLNAVDLSGVVKRAQRPKTAIAQAITFSLVGSSTLGHPSKLVEAVIQIGAWGTAYEAVLLRVRDLLEPESGGNPFNEGTNGAVQPSTWTIGSVLFQGSGPQLRDEELNILYRFDQYSFQIAR